MWWATLAAPIFLISCITADTIVSATSSFEPRGNNGLVVYFGKAINNSKPSLMDLCNSPSIDAIIMAFVRKLNGPNVQPTFDISSCKTPATLPANYTGITCPALATNITACQAVGKKVMISLGGAGSGNLSLSSAVDAKRAADILWNVFGPGTRSPALRPFGNVVLDGFDFDYEGGADTSYTDVLTASLNALYNTTISAGYISATPSCTNSTVLPWGLYQNAHFIFPRFYNANACRAGGKGFNSSVDTWTKFLAGVNSRLGQHYPRFYFGGLGFNNNNTGGGWIAPDQFGQVIRYTKLRVGQERFGGVMLWEGTDALLSNTADGSRNILEITQQALLAPYHR